VEYDGKSGGVGMDVLDVSLSLFVYSRDGLYEPLAV
jgi:hypothetical protein